MSQVTHLVLAEAEENSNTAVVSKGETIMNEKKLSVEEVEKVVGGETKEEYYDAYRKLNLIDGEPPRHNGAQCRYCYGGKLIFDHHQTGPFGNKEAIYICDSCHEYIIYAVE